MKSTSTLLAIVCSLILFVACNKSGDEDKNDNNTPTPTPASATEAKLVAGKWQLKADSAFTKINGKDTSADLYVDLKDCEKDDYVEFFSGGTVTKNENTNKCSGNPQSSTFTWKLMDNDTRIAIYDNNPDTLDLEINSSIMKLSMVKINNSGLIVTYISTYKNIK
ncbi:MAG: lipocalin family protein [Chitinophagales bacterium]|nr:lipocalin family protein [Chitinophagaceae bacterium]MCB9063776.1 lipocalin family protein [Chitinophagales bacterium]